MRVPDWSAGVARWWLRHRVRAGHGSTPRRFGGKKSRATTARAPPEPTRSWPPRSSWPRRHATAVMIRGLGRRVDALERVLAPVQPGPAFVMATTCAEAEREIERLRAEHGAGLPPVMFVMIVPKHETSCGMR